MGRLAAYRVLDPACRSGNFLYLALNTLKGVEHGVHVDAQVLGLERPLDFDTSPANVLDIELKELAAELARVTVWIGELQWRLNHGYPFKQNLVLEPLDHIECRDALLSQLSSGSTPSPLAGEGGGEGLVGEQSKVGTSSHVPPHPSPLPQGERGQNHLAPTREYATAIARAAKRLNDLRERWLNPPEWTERVPEVIPLGMTVSPYPDRILPRANLAATDLAELKKRTLTNLYNQRPAWLADAHATLDAAVAGAYGWADYSAATTDNEILARLLALNHERSAQA